MSFSIRRILTAAVTIPLLVGGVVAASPANAVPPDAVVHPVGVSAGSTHTVQRNVYCATSADGKACVGFDQVVPDQFTPLSAVTGQAVFTLTPAPGHVMSPVSWTTINPNFAGMQHLFCSTSCPTGTSWSSVSGHISQSSLIEFTYNTPGRTHHIHAGSSVGGASYSYGNTQYGFVTIYSSRSNQLHAQYKIYAFHLPGMTGPYFSRPQYVRMFTATGKTLFGAPVCTRVGGPCKASFDLTFGVSTGYDDVARPVSAAIKARYVNQVRTIVLQGHH